MMGNVSKTICTVDSFKWGKTSKIDESFMKHYDKNSERGQLFKVDVGYPKNLHDLHNYLPFSPERGRIKKYQKLVCLIKESMFYI